MPGSARIVLLLVGSMIPKQIRQEHEVQPAPLVAYALTYARAGLPVFPLAGKIPYHGTHGHRDATTDEAAVAQMWAERPKANIGLATGRRSGIIVLDMDVPEGYYGLQELQARYAPLPDT